MVNIQTRFRFESKLMPGVVVIFRRFSVTARAAFNESLSAQRAQVREIQRLRKPLDDEYRAAIDKDNARRKPEVDKLVEAGTPRDKAEKQVPPNVEFPDDKFIEWAASRDEQTCIERDGVGRAAFKAVFVSIEEFQIDGRIPTAEQIVDEAPDVFTDELAEAADKVMGLSPGDSGESLWRGTSEQPEAGTPLTTTASPAESAPDAGLTAA
jgi:hypothetical protein